MNKIALTIISEERNKARQKVMEINHTGDKELRLNYPGIKLKRVYVDLQIHTDCEGKILGVHLKESDRPVL